MNCIYTRLAAVGMTLLLGIESAIANTDTRDWTMSSGKTLFAELVNYELDRKVAVLRQKDGTVTEYPLDAFSIVDQAWLIEWAEFSDELNQDLQHMEGKFSHYQAKGKFVTDYYVYTPRKYTESTNLPMLILLHPAGKGARFVMQFMEAGELLDVIIVSTDGNRNTEGDDAVADTMLEQFKELLVTIDATIPYDHKQLYLGGTSGGALRACHYSAKIQRPWAGIFSNGGWLGAEEDLTLPYPAGIRIAMVNGNNDRAANSWVARDTEALQNRGCEVGLFSFEGGHQVPPPAIQVKAMEWLMRLTDNVYHSPVTTEAAQ